MSEARLSPLPEDFLWGTATSAHQVEGGNVHNDWWTFERRFTSSGAASDFARLYLEDLDRARALGTNTFRFSLEWSRVEPRPGERDSRQVAYYQRLVDACLERGLRPMLTLVQFTLPRWARGGWLEPETRRAFDRHVRFVAEHFGDRVDLFVTLNEPNVLAGAGYLSGVFPPGKRFRFGAVDRLQAELVAVHARAYDALHEEVARRHPRRSIQVGISPHVVSWKPGRLDTGGALRGFTDLFNWGVLDALHSGDVHFHAVRRRMPEVEGRLDFVGLNYFMSMPATLRGVLRLACLLPKPVSVDTGDNGWPIDPRGLEQVLREAHARYAKPIYVTENGVADGLDAKRVPYLLASVAGLQRAVAAGADVRGYYHWSLIDNFEWHEGFAPRFGLFEVDYETQKRSARPSCRVYQRIIRERGVSATLHSGEGLAGSEESR